MQTKTEGEKGSVADLQVERDYHRLAANPL